MTRRTFFSFHYTNDVWRASTVRNSQIVRRTIDATAAAGFHDASLWESTKLQGASAVQRLIDRGLHNTSATCVLIGHETASRRWVQYEIQASYDRGNGLLGVYVHNLKDQHGRTSIRGADPFAVLRITGVPLYDWVLDDGYSNLSYWIDTAPSKA